METTEPQLTHLHVHSTYTLLGATASVEDLTTQAVQEGMTHLALTDTNALYGAVAFQTACREVGIQAIVGMTLTIAPPVDLPAVVDALPNTGLLVLLAQNPSGYRSLCRLTSVIQSSPSRDKLNALGMHLDDLRPYQKGLICLTGGRRGWVERLLRQGHKRAAHRFLGRIAGIFEEQIYLSLELHTKNDGVVAQKLADLGHFLGISSAAVQPIYCLVAKHNSRLSLLTAIKHNCLISDLPPSATPNGGDENITTHWLDKAAMTERFAQFPEALGQTQMIAEQCTDALPDGRFIWPSIKLTDNIIPEEKLRADAKAGMLNRYGPHPAEEIVERLNRELNAITQYGYTPLFLVVADIVRYAYESDIPVSTRGSVANSLVAYCIRITTVDPIAHDLLFERFLSPARVDAPDIDLDFCSRRRDEVLEYVRKTYGKERVASVATISTLQPRSAVRETAKAHGVEEKQLNRILKMLPHGWHPDPRRRDNRTVKDLLEDISDSQIKSVVEQAYALVGQPHHLSIHPGGIVITPGPLTDYVPVQLAAKGCLITQYDHVDVETIGLPKIDLLGIRALTVLADSADAVRKHHNPNFKLADVPADDQATGSMLTKGNTIGIFQCESEGARRTLLKLRAKNVEDLAVANAFFKPGPATGGMADAFVQRYRGQSSVTFLHPSLEPILGKTQGILLFQEQILRVATEIAGLSWQQAGFLRRGMSKMQRQEMKQMQNQFETGCQRHPPEGPGLSLHQAQQLWEQVAAFSGYGFNQGHATAYANISYRSAYIKKHWPAAFFYGRLQSWGGFHHPAVYMAEAMRLGISVRLPHVNHSDRRFNLTLENERPVLWMGLDHVRDLRNSVLHDLIKARKHTAFTSPRDLLTRVPLREKEIKHLIQCGALDGLGNNRTTMLQHTERIFRSGNARQLVFDFTERVYAHNTLQQQLEWEKYTCGYPFNALVAIFNSARKSADIPSSTVYLNQLSQYAGRTLSTLAARIPGRSGGGSIYLWDGRTWVLAKINKSLNNPAVWDPIRIRGRWSHDKWGMEWFQVEAIQELDQLLLLESPANT